MADRWPKQLMIVIYKAAEVGLMVGAAVAFLLASVPALLALLFGLGVQAALFGPVKYGVLPELLRGEELVAGNGAIEATTFLSIVAGMVTGGALILLDDGMLVGVVGVMLSLVGLAAALSIPPLPPAAPGLPIGPNVLGDTVRLLRHAAAQRPIWLSLLGLSWFWTMGATLMTEFPVIARDTMRADGSVLTLLLTVFAVGVGVGSIGCAHILQGEVSPRLVPYAAVGISVFCWDFATAAAGAAGVVSAWDVLRSLAGLRMALDLFLLAACGGAFSVPLYALIQHFAADDERSRMIAANNVMNALFMVGGAGAVAALAGAGFDAPAVLHMAAVANLGACLWLVTGLRGLSAAGSLR